MFENFAPTLADKNQSGTTGTNSDRRLKPVFIHKHFDELPLTVEAYRVYCHLARRANDQNACWPSYRTIGEVCFRASYPDSATSTLRRKAIAAVQELVALNLVSIQARKKDSSRFSNLYFLNDKTRWRKSSAPEVVFPQQQGSAQLVPGVVLPQVMGGVQVVPGVVFPQHQGGVPPAPGWCSPSTRVVFPQHQGGVPPAPKLYPIQLNPIELSPIESPPYPPQGGCERESIEVEELNSEMYGSTQSQETSLLEVKSFPLDLTAGNSTNKEKPIKYDPVKEMRPCELPILESEVHKAINRPSRQRPKFMYPDGPWLNQDGTINGDFIRAQADLWRTGDSTVSKAFGAMAIEDVEAKVCGHYMRRENHAKLELEWSAYCLRSQRYAANVQARLESGGTVGPDEQKKIVSLIPAIACDIEPVYSPPVVQCPQVPTLMLQSAESTPSAAPSPIHPIELDMTRVPLEGQTTEGADAYQMFKSQSLPPVSSPPPDFFAKLKTKMSTPSVNSRDRKRSELDIPAIEQRLKSGGEPTDESDYARQQRAIANKWLSHNGS